MNTIRLISGSVLLLLAALTGCTELRTKEPFGDNFTIGEKDQRNFAGTWYSPTTVRDRWNKFVVTIPKDGKSGTMVMENAEGKSLTYELQFRKIDAGVVFYRPLNRPDEGWQFCWMGMAFNGGTDDFDHDNNTLVLCMPHDDTFTKLGLKVEKRKVLTPPFGLIKKDAKDYESYEAAMLTESPNEISAKIKTVDYRTLMIPTVPIVLIRQDLLKLTAKEQESAEAK